MAALYSNILKTIGRTPCIRINRLAPPHVNIYVKCEFFNPMASVKDRLAVGIMEEAERLGDLRPGQTVVEATSGNTGIGLAMCCAVKGHPCVLIMPEYFSTERRLLLKYFGAKVIVTPKEYKTSGTTVYAKALAKQNDWFHASQFENPANPGIHRKTTAAEILSDFADVGLDYWVTGYGTGGTLTGAGQVLKAALPDIKIVAAEPEKAELLRGKPFESHEIQGWVPDFIPHVLDESVPHEYVSINEETAIVRARELALFEGICTGISGGASFDAALQIADRAPEGSNILTMLPDTGERYLSSALFEGLSIEGDELDESEQIDPEVLSELVKAEKKRIKKEMKN